MFGKWKSTEDEIDMSINEMRRSEEEISARLGAGDKEEHSYSLSVDHLTSGFVACPHCGIWVSKARSFIKVNIRKMVFQKTLIGEGKIGV